MMGKQDMTKHQSVVSISAFRFFSQEGERKDREEMGAAKKKSGKAKWIILGLVVILALVLGVKHELTRIVFFNLVDPAKKLEVENWTGGKTYERVPYSDVSESDYLDLYVPDAEEPPRLMVLVHGGGFVFNDSQSRQAQLMYAYFRDHGYACATVNYRLAQEAVFPAALEDVKAAIRFLKANADTYGYRAEDVIIWGESAGGYLSVMAGMTTDEEFNSLPFIGEEELKEPVSAKISAIVDYYGVMKLGKVTERVEEFKSLGIPKFIYDISNLWLSDAVKELAPEGIDSVEGIWLGKEPEQMSEEEKAAVSPFTYIEKNLGSELNPQVIICHGDADICVPLTHSEKVYELCSQALGEEQVTLKVVANAKHAGERLYTDAFLAEVQDCLEGKGTK